MVQVVELAHRGDTGFDHLEERQPADSANSLWSEPVGDLVHRLSPRPEVIFLTREVLNTPTNRTLEGMGVSVDEPGSQHLTGQALDDVSIEPSSNRHDDPVSDLNANVSTDLVGGDDCVRKEERHGRHCMPRQSDVASRWATPYNESVVLLCFGSGVTYGR